MVHLMLGVTRRQAVLPSSSNSSSRDEDEDVICTFLTAQQVGREGGGELDRGVQEGDEVRQGGRSGRGTTCCEAEYQQQQEGKPSSCLYGVGRWWVGVIIIMRVLCVLCGWGGRCRWRRSGGCWSRWRGP